MIEVECLDCGEWSDDPEIGCAWCDSTNIKIHGKRGGKRKGAGRKPEDDPRIHLPFRLKTSIVEKAKQLGRDRIEAMIKRAKES